MLAWYLQIFITVTCQKLNFSICFCRSGLEIVENGVTIITDYLGRNSGEAFVQFSSQEAANKALQRNRDVIGQRWDAHAETRPTLVTLGGVIGHILFCLSLAVVCICRYIEVFPSKIEEVHSRRMRNFGQSSSQMAYRRPASQGSLKTSEEFSEILLGF